MNRLILVLRTRRVFLFTALVGLLLFGYQFLLKGQPFKNFDPFYIHYYNALLLGTGDSLGNIHNPGIMVALEALLFQKFTYFILARSDTTFLDFSMQYSEQIISAITYFNVGFYLVFLYTFCKNILTHQRGKLALLSIFIGFTPLIHIGELSPDPFLVFSLLGFLIVWLKSDLNSNVQFGLALLLFVLGVSSKYTIVFHSTALLFLVTNKRFILSFFLALVIFGSLLYFLADGFDASFDWVKSLIEHKGKYGSGDSGFIDISYWSENLLGYLLANPLLFIIELFLLFIAVKNYNTVHFSLWVLLIADILLLGLAAKNRFSSHYLLPVFYTMPLKVLFTPGILVEKVLSLRRYWKVIVPIIIIGFSFFVYSKSKRYKSTKGLPQWALDHKSSCEECMHLPGDYSLELAHNMGRHSVGWKDNYKRKE